MWRFSLSHPSPSEGEGLMALAWNGTWDAALAAVIGRSSSVRTPDASLPSQPDSPPRSFVRAFRAVVADGPEGSSLHTEGWSLHPVPSLLIRDAFTICVCR